MSRIFEYLDGGIAFDDLSSSHDEDLIRDAGDPCQIVTDQDQRLAPRGSCFATGAPMRPLASAGPTEDNEVHATRPGHESDDCSQIQLFGSQLASCRTFQGHPLAAHASWPSQTSPRSSSSPIAALPPGCFSRPFPTVLPWSGTATMAPHLAKLSSEPGYPAQPQGSRFFFKQ